MNVGSTQPEERKRVTLERTLRASVEKVRGDYGEVVLHARLSWTSVVDFIPGVAKYESQSSVDLTPGDDGHTHIVVTLDAMHDEHWTKMKSMGWEQQLGKLDGLLSEPV